MKEHISYAVAFETERATTYNTFSRNLFVMTPTQM